MERFQEVCRAEGLKLTHQRMEIFREVAQTTDHPDAETVFRGVRERLPTVSMDTVYRTLWRLKDLGLVSVLGPPRERARFDANLDRHYHFVCTRCGLTRDFDDHEFDSLELPKTIHSIGKADRIQVEALGLCRSCAAAAKPGAKRKKMEGKR